MLLQTFLFFFNCLSIACSFCRVSTVACKIGAVSVGVCSFSMIAPSAYKVGGANEVKMILRTATYKAGFKPMAAFTLSHGTRFADPAAYTIQPRD